MKQVWVWGALLGVMVCPFRAWAQTQQPAHAASLGLNKLVADIGGGISSGPLGPASLGVFAGFQHRSVRIGALLDGGLTWYDWTNFYGVGVGPVLELPAQLRASLLAGVGVQTYHLDDCNEACQFAEVDESALAGAARLGFGRSFQVGRRVRLVAMGWLTGNYSRSREAALTSDDMLYGNKPAQSGGLRLGALLTFGVDVAL